MHYLITFFDGVVTFLSPCILPMLPIYISYFAAGGQDGRRTVKNAAGFVLGFSLAFILMGALAGTLGMLLTRYRTALNAVAGLLVILFGLGYLGVIPLRFFRGISGGFGAAWRGGGFFASALFGIIFSVGWTPCVSAFLGKALLLASSRGSVTQGVALLLCFSLGLGIPFIVSAVLIDRLKDAFSLIKRHYRAITAVSGAFLVLTGVFMMTGQLDRLLSYLTF